MRRAQLGTSLGIVSPPLVCDFTFEPRNANRMLEALCKKAEVRQIRVHARQHSSVAITTGTYIEVIKRVQRNALDGMNSFIEPDDESRNQSTG
ncbi:hypothetical protein [Lentzea albidocapillata]|uniref:Uncharacterized protein n=1 Tax=Lentzea albidocapillata TaxID=40571 RepID=A0A1W2FDL7_9PSEU|nr:hypothetical protein [Lentzea albidocapillata]SMD19987.1 hypothetical protein SAMN05660733_05764 [Lentzea albidocapillata]